MEFEIKNLDFETLIKQLDNLVYFADNFNLLLDRIAKAVETIAQEMVAENETL